MINEIDNNLIVEMDELPEDIMSGDAYKIKLDSFEGPLDLLLHLIKTAKINIYEIFVSQITQQYLAFMNQISDSAIDLDKASEFLEMAAYLLEIKSKSLLPKHIDEPEDTEDPEKELIRKLEEYKLFKEASEKIKKIENVGRFYREPDDSAGQFRFMLKDMTMDGLMSAFSKMLFKIEKKAVVNLERNITLDRFTVAEKMLEMKRAILIRHELSFFELFDDDYSKSEIISTFQALLELLKLQILTAVQAEIFGDILLKSNEDYIEDSEDKYEDLRDIGA